MNDKNKLAIDLVEVFITFHKELKHIKKEIVTECNYSKPHGELLKYLKEHGKSKMSDIGKELVVTRPYVTALVDKLEEKELIYREHDENDRRSVLIGLTEKGEAVFKDYRKRLNKIVCRKIEEASDEDVETMEEIVKLMKKLEQGNFFTK